MEPYHTVADTATPSPFTLWQRSAATFDVNDCEGFTEWLTTTQHLRALPLRYPLLEHARLGTPEGAILVVFHSGAVRVQGTQTAPLLALLAPLVINPAESQGAQR